MLRTICIAMLPLVLAIAVEAQTAQPKTVTPAEAESHIVQRTAPTAPPLAKMANVSGTVKLHVVISPEGDVSSVSMAGGHPMLAQAAIDAVKTWKYKPFVQDGAAIAVATDVGVDFAPALSPKQELTRNKFLKADFECRNLLNGQETDVESACREAVKISDELPKDFVLQRTTSRSLLANYLFKQGRVSQAVPFYEQVLTLDKGRLEPNDVDLASDYENLGRAYVKMGELAKADPLYATAVSTFAAAIENLPSMKENYTQRLKRALNEYAQLKEAQGDTQAAEELRKKAAGL